MGRCSAARAGLALGSKRGEAEDFEQQFWSGDTLQNLYRKLNSGRPDPMSGVFIAAMREFARGETGKKNQNND